MGYFAIELVNAVSLQIVSRLMVLVSDWKLIIAIIVGCWESGYLEGVENNPRNHFRCRGRAGGIVCDQLKRKNEQKGLALKLYY